MGATGMKHGSEVISDRHAPRRYVPPAGRGWYAEALRHHQDLIRAHGPLVADALMDGRPEVLDQAAERLWALSPLSMRRALVASLLFISLLAAFLASLTTFDFGDVVTSPLAVSPLETRAGPAGWPGS